MTHVFELVFKKYPWTVVPAVLVLTDPISHYVYVKAVVSGRVVAVAVAAVEITLHETYPITA